MKNLFTFIVALSLAVGIPFSTAHALVDSPLSTPNPISVETIDIAPPVDANPTLLPPLQVGSLDTSGSNSELASCGKSAGGSLGQIGSQALSQLLNGSGLSSLLGGSGGQVNLSGIVRTLTNGSSAGQIITNFLGGNGNISSILNSGSIGSIASNLFGGSGVGNLLGGGGGIGSSIGNIVSGGGLGGLAGGALGIVGGALGGGEVPVNDSTVRSYSQKIQGNTQKIQTDQDTYIKKVCVQDVLVRQTSHMFASNFTKTVVDSSNTANGGTPIYSQNLSSDAGTLSDAVHTDFIQNVLPNSGIDSALLQDTQQQVNAQYQQDTEFSLKCPQANTHEFLHDFSKGGFAAFLNVMVYNPQCTPVGASLAATDHEHELISTRLNDQEQINKQAEGILPQIECNDPGGSGKSLQQCVRYKIVGPASVAKNTLNQGVSLGQEQQARASQIGDLVDSLFAQLRQKAFTSLKGLTGLSQKSSSGTGSYLDSLAGNTASSATAQAKTSVQNSIASDLANEYTYQGVLGDIILNLENTKVAYGAVQACYQKLSANGGTGITAVAATQKMNQASSTILTVIAPQLTSENAAFATSRSTASSLEALKTEATNAQTSDDINAIYDAYQGLAAYSTIHSESDIASLENDRDTSKTLLAGMVTDANTELNLCKTY